MGEFILESFSFRMNSNNMQITTFLYIFSGIGLLDTLYLTYHKAKGTAAVCPLFLQHQCRTVQESKWSKTFGIPNPYLGFMMNVAIVVMVWLFSAGTMSVVPLKVIISIGFLFSLYFMSIQAFVLKAFCAWCVVSALNFTMMFLAIWMF